MSARARSGAVRFFVTVRWNPGARSGAPGFTASLFCYAFGAVDVTGTGAGAGDGVGDGG